MEVWKIWFDCIYPITDSQTEILELYRYMTNNQLLIVRDTETEEISFAYAGSTRTF